MQKQHIQLAKTDRDELESLYAKTTLTVKLHRRIGVLLLLDEGKTYKQVCQQIGITYPAIQKICSKYSHRASDSTALEYLSDKVRTGRPIAISGAERAKITALACSQPPEGHSGWSLRLLSDTIIELGICQQISHSYVGEILKKTAYNPISNVVGALDR